MRNEDVSWEAMAGEMLRRRIRLEEVDPDINPLQPFGYRASATDIAAAEARLGHPLDAQHAELLRRVNGWPHLFASGDLLGTGDLGQGAGWSQAQQALTIFYEEGNTAGFPPRESIYPIHVVEDSVFVIDRSGPLTDGGHPVFWLAGDLVDRWPNVREFWLAGLTLLEKERVFLISYLRERAERGRSS